MTDKDMFKGITYDSLHRQVDGDHYKSMKIQQSTHLGRALVLGNGESRSWFKPSKYVNHPSFINQCTGESKIVTWGCNAIPRDVHVDNLVSIDYG